MPIINQIVKGGGVTPSGKYQLLDRVFDDTNADIGCVVGFQKDSSNTEYAVVCLNKYYRTDSLFAWLSDNGQVTDLPLSTSSAMYDSKLTATFMCDKIIDYANNHSLISGAVTECRSKSFVIDNITYYGQLPNISELMMIFMNRTNINNSDPSGSGFIVSDQQNYWTANQRAAGTAYMLSFYGEVTPYNKTITNNRVLPILEIPNA